MLTNHTVPQRVLQYYIALQSYSDQSIIKNFTILLCERTASETRKLQTIQCDKKIKLLCDHRITKT